MDLESKYQLKAQKYKMKYVDLKNKLQYGGTGTEFNSHHIMDIIELYRKTLNLYVLYRFRYDNNLPLINLDLLGNLVFKFESMTSCDYKNYYITDLLDNKNVKELLETDADITRMLFTLRQDSTKIIRNILLVNKESVSKINKFIKFIETHKLTELKPHGNEFSEIHDKCIQILCLVSSRSSIYNNMESTDSLDILRNKTNMILNIIANDFERYVSVTSGNLNNISEDLNNKLQSLFLECFEEITKELKKMTL